MSRPFQHSSHNSSNSNSPLSPNARGEPPVSFRTNVNRAKTKRWVEAKKYSYDGDDWGEDEYGEYDDEQTTPPALQSQGTDMNQSTRDVPNTTSRDPSRPPLPSMDRSRSMDQVSSIASTSPPAGIIRPADIYRRMREEQRPQEQAPSQASPLKAAPGVGPSTDTPPANDAPAVSGDPILHHAQSSLREEPEEALETPQPTPTAANDTPILSLPDVKRLSGFNPNLLTETEANVQKEPELENQQPHQLQHNTSFGFRSAVNQAFDVPETPSSTIDSVARSNSDSTTAISPIIGHRGANEDKTPTIEEDPRESMATPTEGDIVFKPGHRRDLSLPSPGNSPSRKPVITTPEAPATSILGQLSPRSPSPSPLDKPPSPQHESTTGRSIQPSPSTSVHDLPAPLNVNTNVPPETTATSHGSVPVIIPSMSTDTSPQDTENDRLRKEIIRSLSNTPSDQQEQETPPQTGRQDNLAPGEYERHLSEEKLSNSRDDGASTSGYNPSQPISETLSLQAPPSAPQPQEKPKLERRFSWEESSEDEDPTPVTEAQSPPVAPMPGQFPLSQESSFHQDLEATAHRQSLDTEPEDSSDQPRFDKLKLTVVPPSVADSVSLSSTVQDQETLHSPATDDASRVEHSVNADHQHSEPTTSTTSVSFETSNLLGFKDILGIKSSEERVKAFNRTRDQFAAIDTGLHHWIKVTVDAHAEYIDIVEQSSKPAVGDHKPSVPRAKFPKLASLGNFTSLHDGSSSTPGHIRRSSATLGSMKQGKDMLHTAGVLGGQAGKAAKGFFSKGRSKLKSSMGSEKGFQSTRGFHRPVRLSDLQPDAESGIDLNEPQRNTAHLDSPTALKYDAQTPQSIPVSRPWTAAWSDGPVTAETGQKSFLRVSDSDSIASSHQPQNQEQKRAAQVGADTNDKLRPEENPSLPSNCADCKRVEQLGAKPQEPTSSRNHDIDRLNNLVFHTDAPSSTGKRPSQPSALMDLPESQVPRDSPHYYNGRWSGPRPATTPWRGDKRQLTLQQLPSVSSLGIQETDLGPPPAFALKLAQHSSSQVSLPSDVSDPQPRHPTGAFRPVGDGTIQMDDPGPLSQTFLAHREAERPLPGRLNITLFPPSQPQTSMRPRSTPSIQYEWPRQPEEFSSTRDATYHKSPSSPMEKLKNVGRLRRISMGSNQPDPKAAQPQKKPFERLTGLFGRGNARHQQRKSEPPSLVTEYPMAEARHSSQYLEPVSPRPNSRLTRSSVSSFDNQDQPLSTPDGNGSFHGQRPPVEGYFAPDSLTLAQSREQIPGPNSVDPTRLSHASPTDYDRLSPQSPRHHPPGSPQRQQRVSTARLSSPLPSPVPRTPPSRGRSEERTYAQDLHLRSRSPKAFPPRQDERDLPNNDFTDPAYNLGTFRENPRTSRCGDQERPWKITIPGEPDEATSDSSATWRRETTAGILNHSRLPTYQEDAAEYGLSEQHAQYPRDEKQPLPPAFRLDDAPRNQNLNNTLNDSRRNGPNPATGVTPNPNHSLNAPPSDLHPHRTGIRAINTTASPIELPVAADDDDGEEILMSSTAYPGQEWRPLGFSEWDHQ